MTKSIISITWFILVKYSQVMQSISKVLLTVSFMIFPWVLQISLLSSKNQELSTILICLQSSQRMISRSKSESRCSMRILKRFVTHIASLSQNQTIHSPNRFYSLLEVLSFKKQENYKINQCQKLFSIKEIS